MRFDPESPENLRDAADYDPQHIHLLLRALHDLWDTQPAFTTTKQTHKVSKRHTCLKMLEKKH